MSSTADSNALHQKAETFYRYGVDAAQKGSYDYAIQMLREACKLHPDNLQYRKVLRATERRKFGDDPAKVGRLVGVKNQPIRMKARSARSKGNYAESLEACEEAFVNNPWDVAAGREAAETAEQLSYKDLAQWFVESVQPWAADVEFFRFAAHIYGINESWPKAIACWEKVKKINPNDEESNRQINALSAQATIKKSGLGEAIEKHAAAGSGAPPNSEDELKQEQIPPEVRLLREIKEDPKRVSAYLQLVDMLRTKSQLDEAQKLLAGGLKAVPNDESLLLAHAEVQVSRLERAIAHWTKQGLERPNDDAVKTKRAQLTEKLNEYEIQEFQRRAASHPTDLNLQYELGLRLARVGRHGDAIAAFQLARSNAALKVRALCEAGKSFEANGSLKLAERTYQEALKGLEPDDTEMFNALHYQLGRVAEAQDNKKLAEDHYNEVAANDYSYRDVAQRLRGLQ